mgnify:CR=1 FL=1|jgi:hypothetical protein
MAFSMITLLGMGLVALVVILAVVLIVSRR